MRRPLLALLLALCSAVVGSLGQVGPVSSASAATLTYAGSTLRYTGVEAAESVTVESITTGVKFFGLKAGQISGPVPSGCAATDYAATTSQIVTCTMPGLQSLAIFLEGGADTLIANGLSKPSEIHGGPGADTITGGSQTDAIHGEGEIDTINSGPAVDSIFVRDGLADTVDCGGALDALQGDTVDVFKGCESSDLSADLVADADGDGLKPPADCNDTRADISPGAYDVPGDGIDQNCDGRDAVVGTASPTPTPVATPMPTPTPGAGSPAAGGAAAPAASTPTAAVAAPAVVESTPTTAATIAPSAATAPVATASVRKSGNGAAHGGGSDGDGGDDGASGSGGGQRSEALPHVAFVVMKARRYTRATKVTVEKVVAGSTVRVTCKGAGCPRRGYEKTFRTGVEHLVVRAIFDRARLRAGARIEVRITRPGTIGRSVRYRVNARAVPDSEVRCLAPGKDTSVTC